MHPNWTLMLGWFIDFWFFKFFFLNVIFFIRGSIGARSGIYETLTKGHYKRGYLPLQDGELLGLVNIHNKEVHFFVSKINF